jgi:hypothetical protein
VLASAIIAGAATIALEHYRATRNRQVEVGSFADIAPTFGETLDPSLLPAPLVPGDPAPNFTLVDVRSGERVRLSDYRGRPVVLVFGSFRCEVLRAQLGRLIELHTAYAGRVAFLFTVIRNAGPPEEGLESVPLTTLIDEHGGAERSYNAFPRRLLIVDAAGRIAFDGARGAIGSNDWDLQAVGAHLDSLLGYTR